MDAILVNLKGQCHKSKVKVISLNISLNHAIWAPFCKISAKYWGGGAKPCSRPFSPNIGWAARPLASPPGSYAPVGGMTSTLDCIFPTRDLGDRTRIESSTFPGIKKYRSNLVCGFPKWFVDHFTKFLFLPNVGFFFPFLHIFLILGPVIAGHTTDYVNNVLSKVAQGDKTGGILK